MLTSLTTRLHRGAELYVGGSHPLPRPDGPLALASSQRRAPILEDGAWPVGVAASIRDRLSSRGDIKGRVLAIWSTRGSALDEPIAVRAWHRDGAGPLYIYDCAVRNDFDAASADLTLALLGALLDVASRIEAQIPVFWQRKLRWCQKPIDRAPHARIGDFKKANLARALALQFRRLHTPSAAPSWMRGAWVGERTF